VKIHRVAVAALLTTGIAAAPVVTTVARVHAQFADGEGGDGGDVSGGDGGAGDSGVLPVGSQNNAGVESEDCFADYLDQCAGAFDTFAELSDDYDLEEVWW
jgi:hypothetical protein